MELKNRKISLKFCFYAIIFLSVIFQTKSDCSPIQIMRYDSSTIPESLKAIALTEAELQPFMYRKMTSRKFTGPRFRNRQRFNMIK